MKVIHLVLGKANPERMNGVNKVAHQLATQMTLASQNVELWGITSNPVHNYPERNYTTRLFKGNGYSFKLPPNLLLHIEQLETETVVHIHGAFIPIFYSVARKLKEQKIKYVYTPHGAYNRFAIKKNGFMKKLYFSWFETSIVSNAHRVHYLGKSEEENALQLFEKANAVVIPNGQDFEEISAAYHQLVQSQVPVFGFCGRLDNYYKAIDKIIEAFAEYKSNGGSGVLWIIGDGPDRKSLIRLCEKLNAEGYISFLGAKYGDEKYRCLGAIDVFVHPSNSEGSPTAVLEACALGIPCIVTTATNMGQEIEQNDCGFHIKTNNADLIEQALTKSETLFYSGELKAMGNRAKTMIMDHYTWPVIASRMLETYAC